MRGQAAWAHFDWVSLKLAPDAALEEALASVIAALESKRLVGSEWFMACDYADALWVELARREMARQEAEELAAAFWGADCEGERCAA
jgi:hypothetical protein